MTRPVPPTTIEFTTTDGVKLAGDLAIPTDPTAAAIICHPHPQYGGNRHDNVVQALFDALPDGGVAALRFDFRATFDDGRGESLDAVAAIDRLAAEVPGVPVIATGYSFGAAIALGLDDERITARVLVAPPLAVMSVAPGIEVPTLVLTPEHDQFSPPEKSEPIAATWGSAEHETIQAADHFLMGRTGAVAERALNWIR